MSVEILSRTIFWIRCRALLPALLRPGIPQNRAYRGNRAPGIFKSDVPPDKDVQPHLYPKMDRFTRKFYEDEVHTDVNLDEDEDLEEDKSMRDMHYVKRARARFKVLDAELGKEPSLLTWAAKDQVRYLHHKDPQEFSAERLSESFPISVVDVKRLLRKRRNPRLSEERIAFHDEVVAKRWKALKTGKDWKNWISENQRKLYLDGKLVKAHFAGNTALPLPPVQPKFEPPEPVPGPFSALIKTYVEMKEKETSIAQNQSASHSSASKGAKSLDVALRDNGKSVMPMLNASISAQLRQGFTEVKSLDPEPTFMRKVEFQGMTFPVIAEADEEYDEEPDMRIKPYHGRRNVRPLRHDQVKEEIIDGYEKKDQQIGDTYRKWFNQYEEEEKTDTVELRNRARAAVEEFDSQPKRIAKYKETRSSRSMENVQEMADDKIVIPEGKRRSGAVYKYGDTFYDENGQFMYRVPHC